MAHRRRIGDGSSGPTTFVAPSTRIIGTIVGEGPYVFCGSVEGECDVDGSVTLAEGGRWHGTIRATDVVVAGAVDGDVIARNRVEIASTGRVSGSLEGHAIAVAVGAVIEGEMNIASGGEPTRFEEKRGR